MVPNWPPPDRSVDALYVHIPFCLKRCSYCDFPTGRYEAALADRYLEALARERRALPEAFQVRTLFVGGGTPSSLSEAQLHRLADILTPFLRTATESTIEANPDTIDPERASLLRDLGFNRVSLGAQSLQHKYLETLGRTHSAEAVLQAVAHLRAAGFDNLNVDGIHGIPEQTLTDLEADVARFSELQPEHLSLYCLIYEEGTPLTQQLEAGRVRRVDEEVERAQYDGARMLLAQSGLVQYEIANYARPGRRCLHNLVYWEARGYYALGNGAAGYAAGVRYRNHRGIGTYLKAVEQGEPPVAMREELDRAARAREALVLGLRLLEGVALDRFAARFDWDPLTEVAPVLQRHLDGGQLVLEDGVLRLAEEALFVSDAVFVDLI